MFILLPFQVRVIHIFVCVPLLHSAFFQLNILSGPDNLPFDLQLKTEFQIVNVVIDFLFIMHPTPLIHIDFVHLVHLLALELDASCAHVSCGDLTWTFQRTVYHNCCKRDILSADAPFSRDRSEQADFCNPCHTGHIYTFFQCCERAHGC